MVVGWHLKVLLVTTQIDKGNRAVGLLDYLGPALVLLPRLGDNLLALL